MSGTSRMRAAGLAAFLAVLPFFASRWASAQTTQPASALALAAAIRAVGEANTLAAAAAAFGSGCNVDRMNVDLNRAYLKRVIRLGRPEIAAYPAGNLLASKSADGLTYWTLAYCSGPKGEYVSALVWTAKAAAIVQDSNALLCQLGQLAAWYDAVAPAMPAADAKALAKVRAELSGRPAYADGYNATKAVEDLKKEASQVEGKGKTEERQALALKASLDKLNSELQGLEREIGYLESIVNNPENTDPGGTARARDRDYAKRAELKSKIEEVRAEMQKHVDATLALRKTLNELGAKLKQAPASASVGKAFRWSVPEIRD